MSAEGLSLRLQVGISVTLAIIEIYTVYVGLSTTDNICAGLNLNRDMHNLYMLSLLFLFYYLWYVLFINNAYVHIHVYTHIQGAANKSNPIPCFVNLNNELELLQENLHGYLSFTSTYKCQITGWAKITGATLLHSF